MRHRWQTTILQVLLGILVAETGALGATDLYEVGQQWIYAHQGPRPGSFEPNAIDGERILQVISVVETEGSKRWIIEERFTADPNGIGRLHVNNQGLLCAIDIENEKGEAMALTYDPPIPYQNAELDVGEEVSLETVMRMGSQDFEMPCHIDMQRLEDETIVDASGASIQCVHTRTTRKSTFNIKIAKIPMVEHRERWYSPATHGLVKEVYQRDRIKFLTWTRDGYTATSTLKTFRQNNVASEAISRMESARFVDGGQKGSPLNRVLFKALMLLCLMAACVVVARRIGKRKKRPQS